MIAVTTLYVNNGTPAYTITEKLPNSNKKTSSHLQLWTLVELKHTRPAFQSTESHAATREWAHVTELVGADSLVLVARSDDATPGQIICLLTRSAVELVGNPWTIFTNSLVDGKALRSWRVESQINVRNVECFL